MSLLDRYPAASFPTVTAVQARAMDDFCAEQASVGFPQLMELAGYHCARVVQDCFPDGPVVALAGGGGNGGDALVAARHLHNWGRDVSVLLSRPAESLSGLLSHQLDAIASAAIPVRGAVPEPPSGGVIVDGLLGFGASGAPRDVTAELIEWANSAAAATLAIDVPSGLDATTGATHGVAIEAAVTVTLAAPKIGLDFAEIAGEIAVADIGAPPQAWEHVDVRIGHPFAAGPIVRWQR